MGTLHNQAERKSFHVDNQDIIDTIEALRKIAEKTKLPIEQVIKIAEIKELERRNNLYVWNGDAHDEQISGIGEYISNIGSNIERLAEAIESLDPANRPTL